MILAYDTETSGLPLFRQPSDHPDQPHIVDICGLLFADDGDLVDSFEAMVRPEGWEIPDEVAAIHGITTAIALEQGIPEADALAGFYALHERASLRVAHNEQFDARIVRIAIKRHMHASDADAWTAGNAHCTCNAAKPILKLPPTAKMRAAKFFGHKPPSLDEALRFFTGDEHTGAHRARADAEACARIYFAMQQRAAAA